MKYALLVSCAVLGVSLLTPSAFAGQFAGQQDVGPHSTGFVLVAEDAKGAEAFIDKMAQQGIGFLSNASIDDAARKGEFKKLLNNNFDMNTIGRFVLGRYWKSASDAQKTEYMGLFKKMIVEVYSRRFSDYQGQKLEVRGSRAEGAADILVNSAIVPTSGPEVGVDWRVRKKDGQYKIVDVIVEGVSMAVTQRADFASVIQRGGGDLNVLLAHLRGSPQ
jgi:phospholipid transport system substrate-binding protein